MLLCGDVEALFFFYNLDEHKIGTVIYRLHYIDILHDILMMLHLIFVIRIKKKKKKLHTHKLDSHYFISILYPFYQI